MEFVDNADYGGEDAFAQDRGPASRRGTAVAAGGTAGAWTIIAGIACWFIGWRTAAVWAAVIGAAVIGAAIAFSKDPDERPEDEDEPAGAST